ncbi:MAG: hypothetical protein AB7I18_11280 [Candidatus Berkiella sp.]
MGVVRSWPLTAVILTGCLVTASFPCVAKHHSLREKLLDFKVSHRTTDVAIHPVFQYLYDDSVGEASQNKDPVINSWQSYKERLRGYLAYDLSDDFRIGLNSFKAGPLNSSTLEILPLAPQLQPRSSDVAKSRGYGLSFTVKLD